jgi:hypothetical protein
VLQSGGIIPNRAFQQVFEATTAALRNELGEGYEWHFVEGTIPVPMDEGRLGLHMSRTFVGLTMIQI